MALCACKTARALANFFNSEKIAMTNKFQLSAILFPWFPKINHDMVELFYLDGYFSLLIKQLHQHQ
jgi:hypothetical protein